MKDPVILKTRILLDNEQLDNKHGQPLRTNPPIPESIRTDKLTIISELTPPLNTPSVLSLDLKTSKGAYGELSTD